MCLQGKAGGKAGYSVGLQAWGAGWVRRRQTPAGAWTGPQAEIRGCLRSGVQEAGGGMIGPVWRTDVTVSDTQVTNGVSQGGVIGCRRQVGEGTVTRTPGNPLGQATENRQMCGARKARGSRGKWSWEPKAVRVGGEKGPQWERPPGEPAQ